MSRRIGVLVFFGVMAGLVLVAIATGASTVGGKTQKGGGANANAASVVDTGDTDVSVSNETLPERSLESADHNTIDATQVTEEFARKTEGVYVRRAGKYYALYKIPEESSRRFQIGTKSAGASAATLYHYGTGGLVMSVGDFPVMDFTPGDKLVGFFEEPLRVYPAEFSGFSVPVVEHSFALPRAMVFLPEGAVGLDRAGFGTFKVTDLSGERVFDWHDLGYQEWYKLSWTVDNTTREALVEAGCRCYQVDRDTAPTLIGWTRAEDGTYVYDLHSLASGTYLLGTEQAFGIVRILQQEVDGL